MADLSGGRGVLRSRRSRPRFTGPLPAVGRRWSALVWAATLAPAGLWRRFAPGELVGAWEMKDARVEVGREMYGLLIIAAWMGVIVVIERRRRARRRAARATPGDE